MIRNLLVISGASLVLAIVGIGGAFALGGADLARHSWTWIIDDDNTGSLNIRRTIDGDPVRHDATRDIAWTAQDKLSIRLPADVRYIQTNEAPGISIKGAQEMIDLISFHDGKLVMAEARSNDTAYVTLNRNGLNGWSSSDNLQVTIRAPSVKSFELSGVTDLEIVGYDQPSLDLLLTGSAEVEVQGRTNKVSVDTSGNATAELDELIGEDAIIRTSGSSGVKSAANGRVQIESSGSSRVRLTRNPQQISQNLSGTATVRQD